MLVYVSANYIVNYSKLLNGNEYNEEIDYFQNYSIYYSKDTGIFFDYPSSWSYTKEENDSTITETILKDNDNFLEISSTPLNEKYEGTIDQFVADDYSKVKNSYIIANYNVDEEEVRKIFNYDVAVLSLTDGKNFYDKYSWINEDNYLIQITVCFSTKNLEEFSTLQNSIHLSTEENENYFKSSISNISFYYPDFLIYLGSTVTGKDSNIVNENFACDEETSITLSTMELDNVSSKDFISKVVEPYQDVETERLTKNGYSLNSSGLATAFNNQFYFYFFENDGHHYNNFYWYEENNQKTYGCELTFRYRQEQKNQFLEIIRSISFGDTQKKE